MKQKFKHKTLTKKRCVASILRFFSLASAPEITEGLNWYNAAKQYAWELSDRFNLSLSQVVGIIAAFSPQTGWVENKRYTLSFLINPSILLRSQVQNNKAIAIVGMNNETSIYHALSVNGGALKTKAFFLNILNPDVVTDVTIDRHAIAICLQQTDKTEPLDNSYGKLTKLQYHFFESCYIEASQQLNILPHQLQAIVWGVYRRIRDLRTHDTLNDWQPFDTSVTF